MIGIVLAGHGGYPEGLVSAAELIMGPQQHLQTVAFQPGESPDLLSQRYQEAFERLASCDGLLVLADLAGGSPFNVAAPLTAARPGRGLVGGANVGMLLEVLSRRDEATVSELTDIASSAGRDSVTTLEQYLK